MVKKITLFRVFFCGFLRVAKVKGSQFSWLPLIYQSRTERTKCCQLSVFCNVRHELTNPHPAICCRSPPAGKKLTLIVTLMRPEVPPEIQFILYRFVVFCFWSDLATVLYELV